jgi:hypothetical protein
MIAQGYEKLSEKGKAADFYRKAATAVLHNPPVAYAVSISKKSLAALDAQEQSVCVSGINLRYRTGCPALPVLGVVAKGVRPTK